MYQPSRGAARRLGSCLRAYQARPQVRAERKREGRGEEGAGRDPPQSRGGARVPFCAGAVTSHYSFPPVPSGAWRGEGSRGREVGVASPDAQWAARFPGSAEAGGVEAGAAGLVRISPASLRLPVSGGDLKGRGRRGSRCRPGADQTDLRAALCSPRILHPDSGPGGKAGPGGPGSGPCAWAGKMATPPAETAPPGHGRGRRTSFLQGLYHSHPFGPTPPQPFLHLCLFSGLPHRHALPPSLFPELPHYPSLRSKPSPHHGWFSPQDRWRRDQDPSYIAAAWMGLGAYLRDLPSPVLGL